MSKQRQIYLRRPADFFVCIHADCPLAASCLRQTSYESLTKDDEHVVMLLNPRSATKTSDCTYYISTDPVRYAKGFINIQERLLPRQYRQFREIVKNSMGQGLFYMKRCGKSAITPSEQEIIRKALREVGVSEELDFDEYVETPHWYPK